MAPHNSSRPRSGAARPESPGSNGPPTRPKESAPPDPAALSQSAESVDPLVAVESEFVAPGEPALAVETEADTVSTLLHHEVAASVAAETTNFGGAGPVKETPGFLESAVDVEELISGLIAAHDLASIPGSTAIQVQLERTLRVAGLTRIEVLVGQPFDPNEQMVAAVEPATTEEQDRCVAREIRSGWVRRNQVVRPAEVVVWTLS